MSQSSIKLEAVQQKQKSAREKKFMSQSSIKLEAVQPSSFKLSNSRSPSQSSIKLEAVQRFFSCMMLTIREVAVLNKIGSGSTFTACAEQPHHSRSQSSIKLEAVQHILYVYPNSFKMSQSSIKLEAVQRAKRKGRKAREKVAVLYKIGSGSTRASNLQNSPQKSQSSIKLEAVQQ